MSFHSRFEEEHAMEENDPPGWKNPLSIRGKKEYRGAR